LIVTNPPEWAKSIIDGGATGIRNHRAIRGDWEQRVSKVKSETWEIPLSGQTGGFIRLCSTSCGNE
jgi:hypothetical protein